MMAVCKGNQEIARFERVTVTPSGALECTHGWGERVQLILAPGQWDSVSYESDDA